MPDTNDVDQRLGQLRSRGIGPGEQEHLDRLAAVINARDFASKRHQANLSAVVALTVLVVGAVALGTTVSAQHHPAAVARPAGILATPAPSPAAVRSNVAPVALVPGQALQLLTIKMVSGTTGWSTAGPLGNGAFSTILRTTDGAQTWRDVTPGAAEGKGIQPAFFLGADRAWAVVGDASGAQVVYRTSDAGQHWTAGDQFAVSNVVSGIQFVDPLHGWIDMPGVPATGSSYQGMTIARTVDGGATWQRVAVSPGGASTSAAGEIPAGCGKDGSGFRDIVTGWVTGGCVQGVTFYRTSNGGLTWQRQQVLGPAGEVIGPSFCLGHCSLSAPVFTSPSAGSMVLTYQTHDGQRGALYTTHDGGASWVPRVVDAASSALGPATFLDPNSGWWTALAGSAADTLRIWRTTDGGSHWSLVNTTPGAGDADLNFISPTRGFAIFHSYQAAAIFYLASTSDAGRTWAPLTPHLAGSP